MSADAGKPSEFAGTQLSVPAPANESGAAGAASSELEQAQAVPLTKPTITGSEHFEQDANPGELGPGSLIAGKLRVIRLLGAGGMGAVYEVEHEITRHRRALKLLHPQFATNHEIITRFLREASAAGRIGSEHIVDTFDAGILDSGEPYLVMEMLEGKSLAERLEARGRLGLRECCDLLCQACEGIQAAHNAEIVHRDIKPDNLFITSKNKVKVLDFGISKFTSAEDADFKLTQAGAAMGTPYYMSPEQASGSKSLDFRSDIYALGVVLYECITGDVPFNADSLPQLIIRIYEGQFSPPSEICGAPKEVDEVIAKAMNRDPNLRYQSAQEFEEALVRLSHGLPLNDGADVELSHLRLGAAIPTAVQGSGARAGIEVVESASNNQFQEETHPPQANSVNAKKALPTTYLIGGALLLLTVIGAIFLSTRSEPTEADKNAELASPQGESKEIAPANEETASQTVPQTANAPSNAELPSAQAEEATPSSKTRSVAQAPAGTTAPAGSTAPSAAQAAASPTSAPAPAATSDATDNSATKPPPPAPNRANSHGLAQENPF